MLRCDAVVGGFGGFVGLSEPQIALMGVMAELLLAVRLGRWGMVLVFTPFASIALDRVSIEYPHSERVSLLIELRSGEGEG